MRASNRIVLGYSGGLDTSVAIAWLAERYRAEIVTVTMDLGQGRDLEAVRDRALALGAARAHVLDLRDEFASDFVLPALQAGALRDGRVPLPTSLSRPLIVKHLVTIARIEGASTIAHGSAARHGDPMRLDTAARAFDPSLKILAPARAWNFDRAEEIDFARQHGIAVSGATAGVDAPHRVETNLWGRVIQGVEGEPGDELAVLSKPLAETPDAPALLDIEFVQGVPVKANNVQMSLVELISSLETIAGAHGVGRFDVVEHQHGGARSRAIYEAPAAVALHTAHRALQAAVVPYDLDRLTADLGARYADVIDTGAWFSPIRGALDAFVRSFQDRVTGVVKLRLFKGECRVVGQTIAGVEAAPAGKTARAVSETGSAVKK